MLLGANVWLSTSKSYRDYRLLSKFMGQSDFFHFSIFLEKSLTFLEQHLMFIIVTHPVHKCEKYSSSRKIVSKET